MFTGWWSDILAGIITVNEILTAGIAITAFSLFIYSLSFNLKDRVARSFAIILVSIVVIYTAEALQSASDRESTVGLLLRLEWLGIIFLPPAYLHLSHGLLTASGNSLGKHQRILVYVTYAASCAFLFLLAFGHLLGPLETTSQPAPYLQRTTFTEIFTSFYIVIMVISWVNFSRAYQKTLTRLGRRRILYLLTGAVAPALGSFPYLLYGSRIASQHPFIFWGLATSANLAMGGLIIVMAYAVAFYGVSWPDRVIKTRLVKWIMRGPVTASITLGAVTIVRRIGEYFGIIYSGAVPVTMAAMVLLMEHAITLFAPLWEKIIFVGGDRSDLSLLQSLEDRLITQGDLRQFLDAVLASIRDHLQSPSAFIVAMDETSPSMVVSSGTPSLPDDTNLDNVLQVVRESGDEISIWGNYWIFPLLVVDSSSDEQPKLLGVLGVMRYLEVALTKDQKQALSLLIKRASQALQDRRLQKKVFRSLEELKPEAELIQLWRAAGSYDSRKGILGDMVESEPELIDLVRDALTHYWGGPRLTQSPLLQLNVVQKLFRANGDSAVNALRSILRKAVESIRPNGERKFTAEWILYNILEMKFIEGRKVREVANKLAMSEADLYRKQRVAIEEVARAITSMEQETQQEDPGDSMGLLDNSI